MRTSHVPEPPGSRTWVIVANGFHHRGGMERANAALAEFLLARGVTVHLVAHEVDDRYREYANVRPHVVRRPGGIGALGDLTLTAVGRRVARAVCARSPGTRVVVNGGNCPWPDVNWVHYVHHAWRPRTRGPWWFALKHEVTAAAARRAEARAICAARLVIANSELTRRHLIDHLRVDAPKVRTMYLGANPGWLPPTPAERVAARQRFGVPRERLVVSFVGGLGHDERKGFDVVLDAWKRLGQDPDWQGHLIVAGAGRRLELYRRGAQSLTGHSPITFLGQTADVAGVLAASDLLVSPARYEPYGLNVQEALLRNVPAITTRAAGVAERYPAALASLLLEDPEDAGELARAIRTWRSAGPALQPAVSALGAMLRRHSWDDMAGALVDAVLAAAPPADSYVSH